MTGTSRTVVKKNKGCGARTCQEGSTQWREPAYEVGGELCSHELPHLRAQRRHHNKGDRDTDWKEWATKRPDWRQENLTSAFERFVERKWQDTLNVAAAEPSSWNAGREKSSPSEGAQDKAAQVGKGVPRVSGAVNVVEQEPPPGPTPHRGTFPSEGSAGRGT
jgi:hypothetical protein